MFQHGPLYWAGLPLFVPRRTLARDGACPCGRRSYVAKDLACLRNVMSRLYTIPSDVSCCWLPVVRIQICIASEA